MAACRKHYGLLGTDVLKVDYNALSVAHVNKNDDLQSIGCLKNFQARILLKKGAQPSYFDARPLPIHLRPLVIKKLNAMIKQGIVEKGTPGRKSLDQPHSHCTKA